MNIAFHLIIPFNEIPNDVRTCDGTPRLYHFVSALAAKELRKYF